MTKPMLFIGGPRDGERLFVGCNHDTVDVIAPIRDKAETIDCQLNDDRPFVNLVRYRRLRLRGEKELHEFFALEELTYDQAIPLLLERYKK